MIQPRILQLTNLKKYLNKIGEKNDISRLPNYELIIQESEGNDQVRIEQKK